MNNFVDLSSEVEMLRKYSAILEESSRIVESLKNTIKSKMEENKVDTVIGPNYKVTYKAYSVTRIDSKKLKEVLPEVADKFSITQLQKRLLVK